MAFLIPDFIHILDVMDAHNVKYLLVGGLSVNVHGYSRGTGDLDVWLEPNNDNKQAFILAIHELNYHSDALSAIDFQIPQHFSLKLDLDTIDFITYIDGVRFEEAYPEKHQFTINGKTYYTLSKRHLILNKLASGRPRDLDDVQQLGDL